MTTPESTRPLDVYDVAVLAGGLPRLVDTAVVALVESGLVRVDPSGEFHARGDVVRASRRGGGAGRDRQPGAPVGGRDHLPVPARPSDG
ncbi:TIGR04222 domain-containing membrane protein [Blastococcus sp. TML/C7B]|uniref:TIGR04222 domain-containing membrane protein n=1 Tax=Blastococcus sp. TML/C7B TaxID=2798728 RepID=UPI00190B0841|nr:TIGR04222 domain-containing membrane protein [Blastococcus sp. TML/C7B]